MDPCRFILIWLAGWLNREQQSVIEYLREEIRVLQEHVGPKRLQYTDEQRTRLATKAKKLRFGRPNEFANLATPQTLVAWCRRLGASRYDSIEKRKGRPRTKVDTTELIVRLARENRHWGYGSIEGALMHVGHDISRTTIARVLKKAGIEPTPNRKKGMNWAEFLESHWSVMAAADFFTTEVWTAQGLIQLATREVKIFGIIPEPNDEWMKQIARNLTDCIDGFFKNYKYLIHDGGSQFSKAFKMILVCGGVKTVRLPRRSPNLNPFAERWIITAKELCINRMIFFGEGSLRRALTEVEMFYNQERPRQGIGTRSSYSTKRN